MKAKGKDDCYGVRKREEGSTCKDPTFWPVPFLYILGRSLRSRAPFFLLFLPLQMPDTPRGEGGRDLSCEQPHLCEFTFPCGMATLPPKVSPNSRRLYGEAAPETGTFFRLQVYKRVGISWVKIYERVRNFGLKLKRFEPMHLKAVSI